MSFTTRAYLNFVVTDPNGRKTGRDHRGSGVKYNEIPYGIYATEGYGDGHSVTTFDYSLISPQEDGVYLVKMIGRELATFTFEFRAIPSQTAQRFVKSINTFLDIDAEMTYKFTYYGNPNTPAKVEKVIAITSLGQDITAGGKLNLVGNQTFVNSLLTQCNQMVNFFNAGNKTQAHSKLNSIKTSIQTAFYNQTETQFVNDYAYTVLLEDIQLTYALINCPTCPMEEARIRK